MTLINHPLDWYISRLANNDYFSLGMYGDGEWQAIFNHAFGDRFTENCEGTKYVPDLCYLLYESLGFKRDNFFFAAPDTFKKVREYFEYDSAVDRVLNKLAVEIEFVEKNVWNEHMKAATLGPLIKQLRTMNVCIISNKALRQLDFLNYDHFIEIGYPNCWTDGTFDAAVESALAYAKPGVYIIAAGIPAALLAQRLHGKIPDSFFLDLGSIWDGFCGIGGQRPFRRELYAHPEVYKKWREDNLKDI